MAMIDIRAHATFLSMEKFLPEIHLDNGGIAIVCGSYVMSFMRVNESEGFFY